MPSLLSNLVHATGLFAVIAFVMLVLVFAIDKENAYAAETADAADTMDVDGTTRRFLSWASFTFACMFMLGGVSAAGVRGFSQSIMRA